MPGPRHIARKRMLIPIASLALAWTVLFPLQATASKDKAGKSTPNTQTKANKTAPLSTRAQKKLFEKANLLYSNGKYFLAAQTFTQLTKTNQEHFAVLYNLGNCFYRLQQYGKALAHYRKAQRLRPNHMDLLHNIQLLQRQLKKDSPSQTLRMKFLFWYYLFNLQSLFYVSAGAMALALLLLGLHIRRAQRQKLGLRWFVAASLTLSLVLWASFGLKYTQERTVSRGVITKSKISARSGYGENFEALFVLEEADEVVIKERVSGWLRVEFTFTDSKTKRAQTRSGWIKENALIQI